MNPQGGSVTARVLARSLVALSKQVFDLNRRNDDCPSKWIAGTCRVSQDHLQTRVRLAVFCLCGDCDAAFNLCSLCCVCDEQSVRPEAWLAAIAGPHASADMARCCT